MPGKKFPFSLLLGGFIPLIVAVGIGLMFVQPVEAQCGSQASSCKNCHEVQAKMPVNTDGTGWHESHAFGDFCYICHAGNQQATDEADAHAGMVAPLSDINASCQMCHASDLTERAQVYAVALGVSLDSGNGGSDTAASTSDSSGDDFWGSDPVTGSTETTTTQETIAPATSALTADTENAVCPPSSQELVVDDASMVDYAQRYNEIVLGQHPANWGNIALAGMIGLLVLGGGGFVVLNEVRIHTSTEETKRAEGEYPADVVEMLPAIASLKVQTRGVLKRIVSDSRKADQVLGLVDTVMSSDGETEEDGQ